MDAVRKPPDGEASGDRTAAGDLAEKRPVPVAGQGRYGCLRPGHEGHNFEGY